MNVVDLPRELQWNVVGFLGPGDRGRFALVSRAWHELISTYNQSYLPLYTSVRECIMPRVLPSALKWNVYSGDLKQGKSGGRSFAIEYNRRTNSFEIVSQTIDASYKDDGRQEEVTGDLFVKPRVTSPTRRSRCGARKIQVVFTGMSCVFGARSTLSSDQRKFVQEAVDDAAEALLASRLVGQRCTLQGQQAVIQPIPNSHVV